MSGVLLRIADLKREPEFHLDQLLDVLRQVPDGEPGYRDHVWVSGQQEPGWTLGAGDYFVGVCPEYQCGFSEEGDGKVLTIITQRVQRLDGASMRMVSRRSRRSYVLAGETRSYTADEWSVRVWVGGVRGEGVNDNLGVAALLAYLRAWGVVE